MAAVGAEVTGSWFLSSSGVVGLFIVLLLLSIFLTALCSDCSRRSFELGDSETDKNPSALIRVVKLEESGGARENPMIREIQTDEKEFSPHEENSVPFTPWRSHLGAPQNNQDVRTNGSAAVMQTRGDSNAAAESNPLESSVEVLLWRSHLRASQKQEVNSSTPPDSDHIYHTIAPSSPPANQEPGQEDRGRDHSAVVAVDSSDRSRNSVYAQVSRKERKTTPPVHTPEVVQVEEEESSPPLPDRKAEMEG
ncbi:uncharacterized protein [Trachinotus anak]|uniref:uncharacterized protein isoform X1 n=1 Tax=Trachinotus anak TaxID=443729 RepID=UPI0039F20EB5